MIDKVRCEMLRESMNQTARKEEKSRLIFWIFHFASVLHQRTLFCHCKSDMWLPLKLTRLEMQDKSSFLLPPSGSPGISPATSVINRRKYFQTNISPGFINKNSIGVFIFSKVRIPLKNIQLFRIPCLSREKQFKNSIDRRFNVKSFFLKKENNLKFENIWEIHSAF